MNINVILNALQYQPSERWLGSALLTSEKVSTLVGHNVPDFARQLEACGMWEGGYLGITSAEADELVRGAEELSATYRRESASVSRSMSPDSKGYILEDKAGYALTQALLTSGHAVRATERRGTLFPIEGDRVFMDNVLFLSGVQLAARRNWRLDVSTRSEATVALKPIEMDVTEVESKAPKEASAPPPDSVAMEIHSAFPSLAPHVKLADVVRFRQENADEFDVFTSALQRLTGSTADDIETHWTEYQAALRDFGLAAKSRRVALKLESRVLALSYWDRIQQKKESLRGIGATVPLALGGATVYSHAQFLQDFMALDQGALVAAGSALTLAFVRTRANSPTAFLRKAARAGLVE